MAVLNDKLLSFDYYKNKLPLYLQTSDGFISHFRIWYDLLAGDEDSGIAPVADTILTLLDIFDSDFLTKIKNLDGSGVSASHPYGTNSDILDKLASFFGVGRKFSCLVEDYQTHVITKKELDLDNEELVTLLKCQVIKNYSEGNYEQVKKFYEDIGLHMLIITNGGGNCTLWLATITGAQQGQEGYYSQNIKDMFMGGLLRALRAGIHYTCIIADLNSFLIWDDATKGIWDSYYWGF